jgi:hypothetical protein
VNGPTRPPLGFPGNTAGPCGFAIAVDGGAALITLRGPATGAGGGAYLTPVPGVELAFDRVGGWLSGMTVAVSEVTGVASAETVAWIAGVFGTAAALDIRDAPRGGIRRVTARARPRTLNALSRLARLNAARLTSPVPSSPLWDGEAADLARRAGLPAPGRPVPGRSLPGQALPAAAAPDGTGPAIPADVMRLLADDGAWSLADPRRLWDGLSQAAWPGTGRPPEGALDLGLVPRGIFLPGLWPGADLTVRAHQDGAPLLTIEVTVAAGVSSADLAGCRARVVDAACLRVLATAPLRACMPAPAPAAHGADAAPRARAELPAPSGLRALVRSGVAWAEVVGDDRRPPDSIGLRRIRRALRWADAALRAESRPHGLATELTDEQWARLAALAWDRCRADWEDAGDPVRAALAAMRGGAASGPLPFLAELAGAPDALP